MLASRPLQLLILGKRRGSREGQPGTRGEGCSSPVLSRLLVSCVEGPVKSVGIISCSGLPLHIHTPQPTAGRLGPCSFPLSRSWPLFLNFCSMHLTFPDQHHTHGMLCHLPSHTSVMAPVGTAMTPSSEGKSHSLIHSKSLAPISSSLLFLHPLSSS